MSETTAVAQEEKNRDVRYTIGSIDQAYIINNRALERTLSDSNSPVLRMLNSA